MKTLAEIRRSLVSFYSTTQNVITDFSVGSVISGIFFSFAASLEDVYRELERVRRQAYIATATGEYLDRLILGTFGLPRTPATRSQGYVIIYANSPITNPESLELLCAIHDKENDELIGLSRSTKFIGRNAQGEEGIVYTLVEPKSPEAFERLGNNSRIKLNRRVQFLVLPVMSVLKGSRTAVAEGGINSFPNPPPGIAGVLNSYRPGQVFFSSPAAGGAPFFSRYTQILEYFPENGNFRTLNSYNFSSNGGVIEIYEDVIGNPVIATYSAYDSNNNLITSRQAGLLFDYSEATNNSISLSAPIVSGPLPSMRIVQGQNVLTLILESILYNNTQIDFTTGTEEQKRLNLQDFILNSGLDRWMVRQKSSSISAELIFDPDEVLTPDYELIPSARLSGGSDADTDAEYREKLRKYLGSLARATPLALEAGALQVPGVAFAKTLPHYYTANGMAAILAADEDGRLSPELKRHLLNFLDREWKAAGVNLVIKPPTLIPVHLNMQLALSPTAVREVVRDNINSALRQYLRQVTPGGAIKYSDVLNLVSQVSEVLNVFNLIILRQLQTKTYEKHKLRYDVALLNLAFPAPGLHSAPYDPTSPDFDTRVLINGDPNPNLYYRVDSNDNVINDAVWNSFAQVVASARTPDEYKMALTENSTPIFGANRSELLYHLSYLMSEFFHTTDDANYPPNPTQILYQEIRDYVAGETEIFRLGTTSVGTDIVPVVGIRFLDV